MISQFSGKTVFLVEHGGIYKEFTLKRLVELGCKIVIFTTDKIELLNKYTTPELIVKCDTFDCLDLFTSALNFCSSKGISPDVITTFKESSVKSAAYLAQAFNLKGPGFIPSLISSQNKFAMRDVLARHGFLNQPKFELFSIEESDLKKFSSHDDFVIKPLFGSSSHGVIKVNGVNELDKKKGLALRSMKPDDRQVFKSFKGWMLAEEYMSGPVLSVDGYVNDTEVTILGATDFVMGDEPYFIQTTSITPSQIDSEILKVCYTKTREVIKILGFQTCGFHCEWRVVDNIPKLLEIAARPVGGGIMLAYEKVTGVNLIDRVLGALLGYKYDDSQIKPSHISVQRSVFPQIEKDSVLTRINMIDLQEVEENVWDFLPFAKEGDLLKVLPETPSQLYYFAYLADINSDVLELLSKIKKIEDNITYEVG